jgi:hypothetical protein
MSRARALRSALTIFTVLACVAFAPFGVGRASAASFDWSQLSPSTSPPITSAGTFDFDTATNQAVLFGGDTNLADSAATWVFQSGTWSQVSTAHTPRGRHSSVMAFDPASNQLVLFGGISFLGGKVHWLSDTWTWSGSDWTELFPAHHPAARTYAMMAYDPVSQRLILFGGQTSKTQPRDTWAWNGTDWAHLAPAHKPTARIQGIMASAGATKGIVLFGGDSATTGQPENDTWTWNGSDWAHKNPLHAPQPRRAPSMSFDPVLGQALLFGGDDASSNVQNDTWTWSGRDWLLQTPTHSPPARAFAQMAFDGATQSVVLFGGNGVSGTLADTWQAS